MEDNKNKISSGSSDLNRWLQGGYDKDIITMIYGTAGSGKTNFCMMVTASQAKKGNKVIFVDTEGGFSIERLRQLCGEETEKAMKNILLLKPTDFKEQDDSLTRLLKEIKTDSSIGLIVIDGMTMLYRLELAEARHENQENIHSINSKLARHMRILASIARTRNIPLVVTNQVYSEFLSDEEIKTGKEKRLRPVGGDITGYWSKCIIELKNERGKRTAVLNKHRSLKESEFDFEIVNEGVRKKGWL
jgi:DNA repair protein RadB